MIIDVAKFVAQERPYWSELEALLDQLQRDSAYKLSLQQAKRFHYLYERVSADMSKIETSAFEPNIHLYLETLVSRAYGEIHGTRPRSFWRAILNWFFETFPQTFRRHRRAFYLSFAITMAGALFGAAVIRFDPGSKDIIIGFSHLAGDPSDRVALEEDRGEDRLAGSKATFSATLMQNNIRVSIMAMGFGMTFAIGTILLLFYNGVIIGAVACDYILAGETKFLLGWLLPHGVVEIPAILLAGQAGFILGIALIGWGTPHTLRARLRKVRPDLVTLIFAVAILLIWAGIIEAFFSQYHEPALPYWLKICFGLIQLALLIIFLTRSGRTQTPHTNPAQGH